MRAYTHHRPGVPSAVLTLTNDHPRPKISKPDDVLVRVTHASLNPGGSIAIQLFPSFVRKWPAVPEMDFSGVIEETGSSVRSDLKTDTLVFGAIPVSLHLKGTGSLAEYIVVPQACVVPKPKECSLAEAAGLSIAGCTALPLLDSAIAAGMKEGSRVLINGASGGIGTFTLQLVKGIVGPNGSVTAMCSSRNNDLVKSLGADATLDYTQPLPKPAPTFDLIIDCRGSQSLWLSARILLPIPGSSYITVGVALPAYNFGGMCYFLRKTMANTMLPRWLGGVPRKYVQVSGFVTKEGLERLARMVEDRQLRTSLAGGEVWDFEKVKQAYEVMMSGRTRGKLVVQVAVDEPAA
ncbi:zinc-binding oxidoreductase [Flagelloscypha sp. PMI_526]|nr:zinc-binding oxidoreductase [Flagelloscypha sp. PMI_526]